MPRQERIRDFGFFYGWGDGGKGPDRIEVGVTQMLAQLGYGKHTNMAQFFRHIRRVVGERVLVWDDEMYLEFHRGTKTSVNAIKHLNRRAKTLGVCGGNLGHDAQCPHTRFFAIQ